MKLTRPLIQCAFPFREPKVMNAFEIKIFMNKVATANRVNTTPINSTPLVSISANSWLNFIL